MAAEAGGRRFVSRERATWAKAQGRRHGGYVASRRGVGSTAVRFGRRCLYHYGWGPDLAISNSERTSPPLPKVKCSMSTGEAVREMIR
uniref:Uncharacterized protein n=1 Tax=Oryza sativa subsp. japonica TaxID=39947 RepID=Q6K9M4_ORYSJ|nr:hypothetical protein [Oryza sativa Japonica Group]BAD19173.1 hypothetical protein [Oryza sativa Japonica Group]